MINVGENQLFDLFDDAVLGVDADDELRMATQAIDSFVKAVKAFRHYPADNPLLAQFLQDFTSRLRQYLAHFPALVIEVQESAFAVNGRTLYAAADLHGSLPFHFYRDGIRELHLLRGIDDWEITGLIDILTRCENANQLEDDLVLLLWEREFINIDLLSVDDYLDQSAIAIPQTVEEFRAHETSPPPREDIPTFEEMTSTHDAAAQRIAEALVTSHDLFRLTPEDVRVLREEIAAEIDETGDRSQLPLLLDLLRFEQDPALFRQLVVAAQELVGLLLARQEYPRVCAALTRVCDMLRGYARDDGRGPLLYGFLQSAYQEQRLAGVGPALIRADAAQQEVIKQFLLLLPAAAAPAVIRLLGQAAHPAVRAVLRDILLRMGRHAQPHLLAQLDDSRGTLVLDVLMILNTLGVDMAPLLTRVIRHKDPTVRKGAVKLAEAMRGPEAERRLMHALSDFNEGVRCAAALALGNRRSPTALTALLHLLEEKDFAGKSPTEIRAVLGGIGASGSNQALELLQNLVLRRPMLNRRLADAMRPHAAHALAMLGTPEALAILRAGAHADDLAIRHACEQALRNT